MPNVGRWTLGVSLSLLNCALSSTGFVLQRKAALLKERDPSAGGSHKVIWVVGVVLYILAAAPDVIAYTMVPQVVCSTIACFRLVVVSALAHTFLHERVQARQTLGMLVCTLGTLLCLAFGPQPDDSPQVSGAFYHAKVVIYLSFGLGTLLALLALEHSDSLGLCPRGERLEKAQILTLPLATGLAYGLEKVFNTEIGFVKRSQGLPLGFFSEPQWAFMVIAIVLLGVTDFCLNLRGAKRMPVQVFVPASFALSTALLYFQSMVIFGEFKDLAVLNAAVSIFGALMSLLGAVCIQPPRLGASSDQGELIAGADPGALEQELSRRSLQQELSQP